jgi:ATP-dependent Clp protease ATP-binding subunit ClpC
VAAAIAAIWLCIVIAAMAVRRYHAARARDRLPPAAPPEPIAPAEPSKAESTESAPQSLADRLHRLSDVFTPFASGSAHPRELTEHADFTKAVDLLADETVPLEIVMQYAFGANWGLACAAIAALCRRSDRAGAVDRMVAHFDRLVLWPTYFALRYFLVVEPRPPLGAPAVSAKDGWRDNQSLIQFFREYLDGRAGDAPEFGPALQAPYASPPASIKAFLQRLDHPLADVLVDRLDAMLKANVDRSFLSTFGRFWTEPDARSLLIELDDWEAPLKAAEAALGGTPARSLLVSGEPLVGKTAFLELLAGRLKRRGWTIFEASGADLMAGQQWFGQLEGRIRRAVEEITVAKKLIWYIPDLLQLARSGTHQGQSASILDQILPAVASGQLVVWTEANPTSAARLFQLRPGLRSLFEAIQLEPRSEAETLALVRRIIVRMRDGGGLDIDPGCAELAVASARQYLGATGLPGSALRLVKLTAARFEQQTAAIGPQDVLNTLSQLTGLPLAILDTKERLDLAAARRYFASRIIGQEEAVAGIVERIAMLKAGLNDPGRPIGVFLFAGPTGTGKTELAKTVCDYLFGSVDRMIRLDMSEFQTPDSVAKILGSGAFGETDSLIERVRKQPFSVVLLDEFEKAYSRIWDLFLQVFDDGRLTDARGEVADFRHCLIILTTNLGATSHRGSGMGFAPPAEVFTPDQIMRAIGQTYRPEFQNRLDKIIVFHPLSREQMRIILAKELGDVLRRRGLKDRAWAVEWEGSALEFLLQKGFSPEMGARPLKRAIDQYVIAPLAETIVERRFPEGEQFVFFRSDGRAIQAEFVDPDADVPSDASVAPAEAGGKTVSLAAMILTPAGTEAEFAALAAAMAGVEQSLAAPEWEELKRSLAAAMDRADFWDEPGRFETLSRLALMDRVGSAAATARALEARLSRGAEGRSGYSRELVSRLALQLRLIQGGIADVYAAAPVEVALAVEPALDTKAVGRAAPKDWCRELLDMYRGWCGRRHMQMEELVRGAGQLPVLLVTGFGAHRVLAEEAGLHILDVAEGGGANRAAARVRIAVPPLGDLSAAKLRSAVFEALDQAPRSTAVVRRYRREPAPLVRNADGSWRTGKLDAVLRGDFDLLAEEKAVP